MQCNRIAKGGGVPKLVDHEERRRALAEAVFSVIGQRGFEAVSLRDVAAEAGVSMGSVQHYFRSKDDMLLFALTHMRTRVAARLQTSLARLSRPGRRDLIRAAFGVLLPVDEPSRQEARVNLAFVAAATVRPAYADMLRQGYERLLAASRSQLQEAASDGELASGIDPEQEAAALYFLAQGLVGPLLIGLFTPAQAFAILDHQLDRIFGAAC